MHWASVCEINDLPHALHESWLRQNPSTTNAAQPIRLSQTARDNEIPSKMKCRTPRLFEHRLKIDFIHQNARSHLGCHRTDLPQTTFVGQGTCWVVEVAKNHKTRFGSEFTLDFFQP